MTKTQETVMGRVSGKVAIVTGAARGMGAAFARRLVEEGATVVLTDILKEEGLAMACELGDRAHFVYQDVTSEPEWQDLIREAEARFGPVSVLVNNAGIQRYGGVENVEERDFRLVTDVNQLAVCLGMKSVIPSMKRAGGGSIINISSSAGMVGSPGAIAYVGSKWAVRGMSKSAAIELAPLNIRVNSVHPGMTETPLMRGGTGNDQLTPQWMIDNAVAKTLLGRIAEPDEIANIVLMLASDESQYVTGAEFVVDGGMTCGI